MKRVVTSLLVVVLVFGLVVFEPVPQSADAVWMNDQNVTQKNWSTYCPNGTYMILRVHNTSTKTHFIDSSYRWWKDRITGRTYGYTLTGDVYIPAGGFYTSRVYYAGQVRWVDATIRVPYPENYTNVPWLSVSCA
jgi:hypothetical protein